ncbi:DUF4191 family protein [Egibacter rhizosphaerae]|uniref:DUF4191 family protein n=1 Tax=Egibacter rhizosphaerae TaxID=1670831 RepID=A0A411YEU1_9ACTN|nr:DUF4191 domain-containing protein [Egibacter rhizosphaerae]QBI19716.1 DUF4191 family protein [Egibacter rhizosphaerae]
MAVTDTIRARMRTVRAAFVATKHADRKLLPLLLGIPLATLAVLVAVDLLVGWFPLLTAISVPLALLLAVVIFGQRASKAQFAAMRGRPGAAASVLESMRGQWLVTAGVAFSRKQDLVHRVVGRCGVVLVGEGAPARTRTLLKQEERKAKRVVGDTPIHTVLVGEGDGRVPIEKLRQHLMKKKRALKKREVAAVNKRLTSLPSSDIPIPKGPLPGGMKMPRARNR